MLASALVRRPVAAWLVAASAFAAGCGGAPARFPLREAMWKDGDTAPVTMPCKPDPKEPGHAICTPETYESPFAWDVADKTIFRPITRFFAVDVGGEAKNVNALDEIPDSSWFENRIGMRPMTVDEVRLGSCGDKVLDPSAADGAWVIDQGKPNGANPGFRVRVEGVGKFMLKADPPDQPERATGATSIASRLYHAAGWWAPCDSVVYFRPSILKLKPGLEVTDNSGVTKPFDEAALARVLENSSQQSGLVRMVASRWLPGRAVGPYRYEETRDDDPNDVIPHEDRRDLRGARLMAAWLNHFDSREQNTMATWLSNDPKDPDASPGHLRHYIIDLGDCFGSEWEWDAISRRLGHSYYLDLTHVAQDFVTLGIPERPWDRAERSEDGSIFGYFSARDFDPETWKGGYPNPAFSRMTELDGAWFARILARFTSEHVAAAVAVGDYSDPNHTSFLTGVLLARQRAILSRYLSKLSPIADLSVSAGGELCGVDLAKTTEVAPATQFRYSARLYAAGTSSPSDVPVEERGAGQVCVKLPHHAADGGAPPDAAERYLIVDVANAQASGPLRAHLYDLGPAAGFRLVGIERPEDASPPG